MFLLQQKRTHAIFLTAHLVAQLHNFALGIEAGLAAVVGQNTNNYAFNFQMAVRLLKQVTHRQLILLQFLDLSNVLNSLFT